MRGESRTIPFTRAQRSTIQTTAWLMLIVGAITFITGVYACIELLPLLRIVSLFPLIFSLTALSTLIELGFGTCLLVAGLALIRGARAGTVDALLRGLRALCVVYVAKAALVLIAAVGVVLALLGVPLLR